MSTVCRLVDMNHAIDQAQGILGRADFAAYEKDAALRFAIERCLGIVATAVEQLPVELTERYPDLAWAEIARMGRELRYRYWDVQNLVIWRTARNELPKLKPVIQAMIDQVNKQA